MMFKFLIDVSPNKRSCLPMNTTDVESQAVGSPKSDSEQDDTPPHANELCRDHSSPGTDAGTQSLQQTAGKKKAPNYCFLCVDSRSIGPYVVSVGCRRYRTGHFGLSIIGDTIVIPVNPDNDTDTFTRLRKAYFASQGEWKRWLPFYDVLEAREVNVRHYRIAVTV